MVKDHKLKKAAKTFSVICRYTEDGSHLCVGLIDGSIKVVSPATSQIVNRLASEETSREAEPVCCIRTRPGQALGAACAQV